MTTGFSAVKSTARGRRAFESPDWLVDRVRLGN